MATDANQPPEPAGKNKKSRGLRSAGGFIVFALVVGAVMLMLDLYEDLPDLYNQARVSLSRAESHLDRSYDDEEDLLSEVRAAHRELDTTIALLERAEEVDPAIKGRIEAIRVRLEALKKEQVNPSMTPQELHRTYRKLLREVNDLLKTQR
jgi:septal ring factor EnvC (AmiA/AmiB activator)